MLRLRLTNPVPESLAHNAPLPQVHPEFPLKPRIEPKTGRAFQVISLPQKDGSFVASVLEAPTIRIYDRSRKVAEERASRKFLKTPDRYAYKRHPLAISKAVTIDMEYDADAAAFVTYVNELHRMSSFGETESAALDNTAEMIRGYIGSMEANRKTIPLANSKTARTETAGRARLMSSDPAVSGKDAVRALSKLGFRLDRVEGSHHMMVKMGIRTPFPSLSTVPCHYPEALREASFAWRVLVRSGFLQR